LSNQTYPLVDLSPSASLAMTPLENVDPRVLATQLNEIGTVISDTLFAPSSPARLGVSKVEIALTIGAEGGIWFVARGTAEASITLTLEHPTSPADAEQLTTPPAGGPSDF
jgi:hypothetical protein